MVVDLANHGALARELRRGGGERAGARGVPAAPRGARCRHRGPCRWAALCGADAQSVLAGRSQRHGHTWSRKDARERGTAAGERVCVFITLATLPMADLDAAATLDLLQAELKTSRPIQCKTIRVVRQ